MSSTATALKFARDVGRNFDVLAAFQSLESHRKMALYDIIMFGCVDGGANLRKTIEFLWPQASHKDAMKLEMFLRERLSTD